MGGEKRACRTDVCTTTRLPTFVMNPVDACSGMNNISMRGWAKHLQTLCGIECCVNTAIIIKTRRCAWKIGKLLTRTSCCRW